jgi:mRNA-degrading endonuclease RelE of RelBE toxin-antitoxin system
MPRRYRVIVLPGLEREARQLRKRFPGVYTDLLRAIELLETDPFDLEGRANIRKLVDVPAGEGQFRLRLSDYRLRYDVTGDEVVLHSIRPLRESYR